MSDNKKAIEKNNKKKENIIDKIIAFFILFLLIVGVILGFYLMSRANSGKGFQAGIDGIFGTSAFFFCAIGLLVYLIIIIIKNAK